MEEQGSNCKNQNTIERAKKEKKKRFARIKKRRCLF
jgi:hypothetical protein